MRGLVYVKRDMRHQEAPLSFEKEAKGPLSEWMKWMEHALRVADDSNPMPGVPDKIKPRDRVAARVYFAGVVDATPNISVERLKQILSQSHTVLGSPWQVEDGTSYLGSSQNCWFNQFCPAWLNSQGSGLAGLIAVLEDLRSIKNKADFLPKSTVVEPWNAQSPFVWAYDLLDKWVENTYLISMGKSVADRKAARARGELLTPLVHVVDNLLMNCPSPHGLPLHWQVAARQAEKSLVVAPPQKLAPLPELPPIHSQVTMEGRVISAWMGVSEWQLARFARKLAASKQWDDERWRQCCEVMKKDFVYRDASSLVLLEPFREHLERVMRKNDEREYKRSLMPLYKGKWNAQQLPAQLSELNAFILSLNTPSLPRSLSSSPGRRL